MARIRNILLDRDGTIIKEKHYLKDPEEVELLPGALKSLRYFSFKRINLFMVTNQSGIGRGYFKLEDFFNVQNKIYSLLEPHGVLFKEVVFCPHTPDDRCECRKPKTGMWEVLKNKYNLSPDETIVIGDKISDILFGKNAGLKLNALVITGYGKEHLNKYGNKDIDIIAKDLWDLYIKLDSRGYL
jgi:D-glycero-D-manno-heptose 1,7-bisphosphate phosphatase